jgi:hypothetical protein
MLNEARDPVTQRKAQSDQYYSLLFFFSFFLFYLFFTFHFFLCQGYSSNKLPNCIQDIDNRHN